VALGIIGLVFALIVGLLARQRLLSLRYTLGWFFVAVSLVAAGALSGIVRPLARDLGIRPLELLLGISLLLMLLIAVQLSISASGQIEMIRDIAETAALTEERLHRLEAQQEGTSTPATAGKVPRKRGTS
jgi:hypothetical protein